MRVPGEEETDVVIPVVRRIVGVQVEPVPVEVADVQTVAVRIHDVPRSVRMLARGCPNARSRNRPVCLGGMRVQSAQGSGNEVS